MALLVFISYSTKDLTRAREIAAALEGTGSTVFLAEYTLLPGAALTPAILAAIKACDLFLLMWSAAAQVSEWVPQEIGVASAHEKPIVPVFLEAGLRCPGFLQGTKYLRYYQDHAKALAWLRTNVYERAEKKQQREGLVWLGLGAVVLWAMGLSSE